MDLGSQALAREATETVAAFIARHTGCDPDAELTKRLQNQATNG
jgi:hypothetical protein